MFLLPIRAVRARTARSGDGRVALVALTAAAALLLSGCSDSGSGAAPQTNPSITFGAQASTTPGLTGTGMGPMGTAAPAATGASTAPGATSGGSAVSIDNFAFAPPTLTVPVGATVTWTNHDGEAHTVVANDGPFKSPGMDTNATFSFTFQTAGRFDYICSIHPFMHGTVVVTK